MDLREFISDLEAVGFRVTVIGMEDQMPTPNEPTPPESGTVEIPPGKSWDDVVKPTPPEPEPEPEDEDGDDDGDEDGDGDDDDD